MSRKTRRLFFVSHYEPEHVGCLAYIGKAFAAAREHANERLLARVSAVVDIQSALLPESFPTDRIRTSVRFLASVNALVSQ